MTDTPRDTEDPGPAPAREPASAPDVERSISPISGRLGSGMTGKAIVVAALVVGCGVFLAATWGDRKPKPDRQPEQPARQVVPFEPIWTTQPPTLTAPGTAAPNLTPGADGPQVPAIEPDAAGSAGRTADPAAQRRAELAAIRSAPMLAYSRGSGTAAVGESLTEAVPAIRTAADGPTELDQLRRGSSIGRARAARLGDRNFLILAGTAIPCLLQTAMDTSTPGYVSCLIPRDVMSDNGAVVLMEKGTKVLGEYRSGMRQGQKRLFVLWTRAVTPAGVAIALASPAADPLGRAGFDGAIDTHFWDRFGGALLLSIVDDGVYAISGNGNQYQTARVPSDAAGIALQGSINIPPTLRKAQGSEVSIFVAQDFDFSGVYDLKTR
jgi:type IV secretion system protein VirB10